MTSFCWLTHVVNNDIFFWNLEVEINFHSSVMCMTRHCIPYASWLKGPGRPINSVDRRMAVLAGLGAVDWVVSFAEDTPENLLRALQPDVLVKGGDYGIEGVVGADIVRAYGGEVRVLGLVENSSTTAIVEKIRSK